MPKHTITRSLYPQGPATVFMAMSGTRPGHKHYTIVLVTGSVLCSCEGFCMHGHCWHVDSIPMCTQTGGGELPYEREAIELELEDRIAEIPTRRCSKVQQHLGRHLFTGEEVKHEHDFTDGSGKCSECGEDPFEGLV